MTSSLFFLVSASRWVAEAYALFAVAGTALAGSMLQPCLARRPPIDQAISRTLRTLLPSL